MKRRVTIYQHPTMPDVWVSRDGMVFCAAPVGIHRGYVITRIRRKMKVVHRSVASIVLETFRGPRPAGAVARHLNDRKSDNRASNLAWGTQADNANDALLNGRLLAGEKAHNSRLSDAEVREIITRRAAGEAVTELAREFGVKTRTLWDIFQKRTWISKDPAYKVWASIIQRCTNPNVYGWRWYGGRGITVCDRWRRSFRDFLADVGPRPGMQHELDREDEDGNYEPGNCSWVLKRKNLDRMHQRSRERRREI